MARRDLGSGDGHPKRRRPRPSEAVGPGLASRRRTYVVQFAVVAWVTGEPVSGVNVTEIARLPPLQPPTDSRYPCPFAFLLVSDVVVWTTELSKPAIGCARLGGTSNLIATPFAFLMTVAWIACEMLSGHVGGPPER